MEKILLMESASSVKTLKIGQNKIMKILQRKTPHVSVFGKAEKSTPSCFFFFF